MRARRLFHRLLLVFAASDLVVSLVHHVECHDTEMGGIEPRVNLSSVVETVREQPGADQGDQGESHLGHYQECTWIPGVAQSCRDAAALLEVGCQVRPGGSH